MKKKYHKNTSQVPLFWKKSRALNSMLLQRIADWGGPPRSSTTCEMRCCHTKGYSFPTSIFWERSCGEVRMYQKQTLNIKYTQTNLWFQTKKKWLKKKSPQIFSTKIFISKSSNQKKHQNRGKPQHQRNPHLGDGHPPSAGRFTPSHCC